MSKFTNEQIKSLQERANEIAQGITDEKSTTDIMAQLYVDAFEGKTFEQGKLIADTIVNAVSKFDLDFAEAQVDVDHFISKFQRKIDKDKTCYERCQYWRNFALAVTAATIELNGTDPEVERIVKELGENPINEEEANKIYENKLRQLAFDAVKNSTVITEALAIHSDELNSIADADEAAQLLIDLGNKDVDYRSIVSMLAYIGTVNGDYPEIPVDMTASQISTLVCTEIEQVKIIDAFERGDITLTTANCLLNILGVVAIIQIAVVASAIAVAFAATCFGSIMAIPACMVMIAGIIHLMFNGIRAWERDSQKIVITVVKSVRSIAHTGVKLVNYMKDVLVPRFIDTCKQRLSELKNKRNAEETVAETVTV